MIHDICQDEQVSTALQRLAVVEALGLWGGSWGFPNGAVYE
jgi:hypothetical protein